MHQILNTKMLFSLLLLTAGFGCATSPIAEVNDEQDITGATLTHITTHSMKSGTHRPEILAGPDGDIYLVVVDPIKDSRDSSVRIKHRAYHLDTDGNQIGEPFAVSTITEEYGDPSDHRALIVDDELVVVYQTNHWKDDAPARNSGAMEDYSSAQSLMLARFTLDGELIVRTPIVDHAPTGSGENFPDLAIVSHNENLLVTTGTRQQKLTIREVDLNGTILSTHTFETGSTTGIGSEIGNALHFDVNAQLVLVSGNGPQSVDSLLFTTIDDDWNIVESLLLPPNGQEQTFPTGYASYGGLELISYLSREPIARDAELFSTPYRPYLKVLGENGSVLLDEQIGESGYSHVHPTVTVIDDQIFIAWSKKVNGSPQVQIEEYALTKTLASDTLPPQVSP